MAAALPSPSLFAEGFELPAAMREEKALFSLGGPRSGANFHQHADAWNCVVFGRKRWGLLPAASEFHWPVLSSPLWWERVRPRLLDEGFPYLHECVQEAGDVLFVPGSWYHSVENLMTSVSLAVQIGAPSEGWKAFGIGA